MRNDGVEKDALCGDKSTRMRMKMSSYGREIGPQCKLCNPRKKVAIKVKRFWQLINYEEIILMPRQ